MSLLESINQFFQIICWVNIIFVNKSANGNVIQYAIIYEIGACSANGIVNSKLSSYAICFAVSVK